MALFNLEGKVAIVTGASSGLGFSAAKAFAENGASVALLARRKEKLEAGVQEIIAAGGKAIAVECDVTQEENVKKAVDEVVKEFGTVHILLNNAGVAQLGTVETLTMAEWNRSMDANVTSIFLMSKYVIPLMRKQKYGKVINISSINAFVADKGNDLARHVYNTSKAAVRGLTLGMAATYMEENITVNSVGPGLFESEMTENTLFAHEGFMKMYNSLTPASRPAKKGELNGTLLYLASDASSYVTGQYILVDGGFSLV
ncbi:SDR family NAD(P)-dependent oxidoreductase [Methanimicrococcus blatticola]|uniref:Gluconate 5-dehydrogenase n=1 Tax=Methanimicrococcus blatticola TaxID=91560 RepID=A0A484F875_9EURY|nr:SDR family oxidoreductase [Methanimicrococcus blatticola]MBZ3935200.1 SDR family oxidoreductase [Methanimicrococcus blatticola]MCC2508703.1 SDR family oxidoreductase [Methanimicrococcus blatticola]TDQ71261.1 gluconate 5-dehydrogenase [Methanimicrococcus blatticola]